MPFDPRLIPPEPPPLDPDGEISLPDDLALLAEQLADDAQHLARCYPPAGEEMPSIPPKFGPAHEHRGRQLALILGSGLACSLLVVALGLFAARTWHLPSLAGDPATVAAEASDSRHPRDADRHLALAAEPAAHEVAAQEMAAHEVAARAMEPEWPLLLRNVSQPELEGLIDLWQDQSPAAATVSF